MNKFTMWGSIQAFLCLLNVLLGLFFLKFISISTVGHLPTPLPLSFDVVIKYVPNLIVLTLSVSSFLLAYAIGTQKGITRSLMVSASITGSTVMWFLLIFSEIFGTKFLLLFSFTTSALIILFLRNVSLKAAGILSFITVLLTGLIVLSNFEENYCWEKGNQAEPGPIANMIAATNEDARKMSGYGIKPGDPIGISFRAHMLCHDTFRFSDALKETMLRQ